MLRSWSCIALLFAVCVSGAITNVAAGAESDTSRGPNVVFILADDLGWSDTTLYGTTTLYKTPNVERLAARGMTFNRAYSSSPLCSPTRASVLTGQCPARTGILSASCHRPNVVLKARTGKTTAKDRKSVPPVSATRLSTDYMTMPRVFKEAGYATAHFGKWHLGLEPFSPLEHGFDIDVPHWPGPGPAGSYVAPWRFPDFDPQTPNEHIEDRVAQEAVRFIEDHCDEPFFLNYWMFSVHAPFDAKQDRINQYRKLVRASDPQSSPTYAAMVESMDDAVGTLLDTLDRLDLTDNTIIVFASDNGGNMYNEVDGTTATSNAPLRGGKATLYEGGVRGPAIIAAPGIIEAGVRCDEVIQSMDYFPTLLDLAEIDRPNLSFDGLSLSPLFHGQPLGRDAIFSYFPVRVSVPDWLPPAISVTAGDWKLIRIFHHGEGSQHRYKLFHLAEDIGELHDVSAAHPDIVARLDSLIEEHLVAANAVRPTPNPSFDPAAYDASKEGRAKLKSTTPRRHSAGTANTSQ